MAGRPEAAFLDGRVDVHPGGGGCPGRVAGTLANNPRCRHAGLMAQSMHDSAGDPRNADILIDVNGTLKPRAEAMVSVFDSGFVLGDGVWEGLRVHRGRLAFLGS